MGLGLGLNFSPQTQTVFELFRVPDLFRIVFPISRLYFRGYPLCYNQPDTLISHNLCKRARDHPQMLRMSENLQL